jgi:type IV secretory pathway protease TraF
MRLVGYLRRRRPYLLICACAAVAQTLFMGPSFGWYGPIEIYNTSPSVPVGRYWLSFKWPPERGDIVMLRDPPGFKLNWLLKRVEGVGGDRFCWRESELRHYLNERPMPVIPPQAIKAKVPIWRGCRTIMSDEAVGFGEHFLAYGSQYLGPVRLDELWGVYRRR